MNIGWFYLTNFAGAAGCLILGYPCVSDPDPPSTLGSRPGSP